MRVPYEKRIAFTRQVIRVKMRPENLADLASDAYLAYWRGFVKTGNDSPSSFRRDVLDAWDRFTHRRNKTRVPKFWTNVERKVFERREAS